MTGLSFVIPVYNEADILKKSVDEILWYCRQRKIEPEILLCDNGSTDETPKILNRLKKIEGIVALHSPARGLGSAYKMGVLASTKPLIYFTGIDIPFGLKNIDDSLDAVHDSDFVFSSKAHPGSVVNTSLARLVVSKIFRFITMALLPVKIEDPQGCVMGKNAAFKKAAALGDSAGAFFQTQVALYATELGYSVKEIPVVYTNVRLATKFKVASDGFKVLREILRERTRLRTISRKR